MSKHIGSSSMIPSASGRLRGKVALITGAGSGVGHAMTKLFAEEGASVAAIVRRNESFQKWANVENVLPVQADITQLEQIDHMVEVVERQWGRLDIVCNVAGVHDLLYPLDETSDEMWDRVLDLDLKAPFRICRRVIKGMVAQQGGAILNMSSLVAMRGLHGPSYCAAKAGLIGMSLSIAVKYANSGIRCNVINPGPVNTSVTAHSGGELHAAGWKMLTDIYGRYPIKLICEPEEIALSALFLCSDESKHVNGAVLAVDGGMSAC